MDHWNDTPKEQCRNMYQTRYMQYIEGDLQVHALCVLVQSAKHKYSKQHRAVKKSSIIPLKNDSSFSGNNSIWKWRLLIINGYLIRIWKWNIDRFTQPDTDNII